MLLLLFNNNNTGVITGVLAVTEATDIVAFSGDVPILVSFAIIEAADQASMSGTAVNVGWVPVVKQAESWTNATIEDETWTPAVKQAEVWTVH